MTPQQLIDLNGYGSAVKVLKAQGQWHTTLTDTERINWLAENVDHVSRLDYQQSWKITVKTDDYDPDFLRQDIDNYATAHTQGLYSAYLED